MASIIVRTQAANKKGLAPLYLYYYHNRLKQPFALGYSIRPDHLNQERNRVTDDCPDWIQINQKISEYENRIYKILKNAPTHIEPTHLWMKEQYPLELEREKKQQQAQQEEQRREGVKKRFTSYKAMYIEEQQQHVDTVRKSLEESPYYQANSVEAHTRLLQDLIKYYDKFVFEKEIEPSTMKAYKAFRKLYFEQWVNSAIYKESISQHSISVNPSHANATYGKCFNKFLIEEKKYTDNMIGKTYKILKQYLSWLETHTELKVNRQYTEYKFRKDKIKDFVVIEQDEIDLIWDYRHHVTERESKVLDLVMFSLFTGIRISEVLLNTFAVYKKNGREYLTGITFKNKSKLQIPLWFDERLLFILNKHNPDSKGVIYKMNLCSAQEFNRVSKQILKKVYELHGIHQAPISQQRTALGKEVIIGIQYKWELFTSRTCRRSAITLWRNVWKLRDKQIQAIIGTKKAEILEIYNSEDREQLANLLEDIDIKRKY